MAFEVTKRIRKIAKWQNQLNYQQTVKLSTNWLRAILYIRQNKSKSAICYAVAKLIVMPFVTMIYRWQITLNADKMETILMTEKKQIPTESSQSSAKNNGGVYEIRIRGLLDDHWQQWFEGMTLKSQESAEAGQDYTLIRGWIVDQPALHGLLAKIRDLNLALISVTEMKSVDPTNPEGDQNDEAKNPCSS